MKADRHARISKEHILTWLPIIIPYVSWFYFSFAASHSNGNPIYLLVPVGITLITVLGGYLLNQDVSDERFWLKRIQSFRLIVTPVFLNIFFLYIALLTYIYMHPRRGFGGPAAEAAAFLFWLMMMVSGTFGLITAFVIFSELRFEWLKPDRVPDCPYKSRSIWAIILLFLGFWLFILSIFIFH
jgi:hypothetical protein